MGQVLVYKNELVLLRSREQDVFQRYKEAKDRASDIYNETELAYCSHHNPKAFAVYDSYVEKCLKYFKKIDKFSNFERNELKDHAAFNRTLNDFKKFYHLEQYSLKEIDKYLWQLGKEYFPNKY